MKGLYQVGRVEVHAILLVKISTEFRSGHTSRNRNACLKIGDDVIQQRGRGTFIHIDPNVGRSSSEKRVVDNSCDTLRRDAIGGRGVSANVDAAESVTSNDVVQNNHARNRVR